MRILPLFVLFACSPSEPAGGDSSSPVGTTDLGTPLEALVKIDDLMGHLEQLQAIADANNGTRAVGTPGFTASADYGASVFEAAGYTVTREPFSFSNWMELGPAVAEVPGDPSLDFAPNSEIAAMTYSAQGDVTAGLTAVDLVLPPTPSSSSTSGCEAADFAGFPAGNVALIQRGQCNFQVKVDNAAAAGAVGVLIFNEGQAGRTDLEPWTLDEGSNTAIPVVGASFSVGDALATALGTGPVTLHLVADAEVVETVAENVMVETGGDPDHVLVVGGHLDSVPAGPGINDNGTGVALVLELANAMAARGAEPTNRIRFALWGGEELGLLGSNAHVAGLSDGALGQVMANLNFDMVGSPNGLRMVYDGDGDDFGQAGPDGSDAIEAVFREWFASQDQLVDGTQFDGRSDYLAFILNDIPAGGLFSGAEDIKRADEADRFGGQAGSAHDPCYHQACDTIDNIDRTMFEELSVAAAFATRRIADDAPLLADRRAHWVPPEVEPERHGCGGHHGARK